MWLSDLQDYHYVNLESYWFDYKELASEKSDYEPRRRHLKNVVEAIEKIYNNEPDGVMKELIEQGYFSAKDKKLDPYIHEQLGVTKVKLSRMRSGLMQETAELIGYVV